MCPDTHQLFGKTFKIVVMVSEDEAKVSTLEQDQPQNSNYDAIGLQEKLPLEETCSPTILSTQENPKSPTATPEEQLSDNDDANSISGQRNTMSSRQLRIAIPTLSVCLFVSFVDQTSVSTATPAIAGDLNTGAATSWIGTSFLIASTAFQLINGRLSDVFGRKGLLLLCLALLAFGDLGCGFAQTAEQLFALRAIAGVGGGGINSLVMIIVSDITTLQNRGKYQGTCFPFDNRPGNC